MKLFGIEIKKAKRGEGAANNPLAGIMLAPHQYGRELTTDRDVESLLKAYRSWVYVCANKNATTVASIPLKLYVAKGSKGKGIKGWETRAITKEKEVFLRENPVLNQIPAVRKAVEIEELLEHPFLDLMRQVNQFMNQFSLWEITELYQELAGNAYWLVVDGPMGIPQEIWPITPQNIKIVPDQKKFIRGYNYKIGMTEKFFEESQIIHFKMPSPTSQFYGKSPLSAVTDMYNIGQNMNIFENAVFSNMGRVEGIFTTKDELYPAGHERLKEEIKQAFGGVKNAGKSPLLPPSVDYKSIGLSPRELNFIQGRKSVKEEICNAYGQSVAMYDKESNRANAEAANYMFLKDTIRPRCIRIEEKLNEKFMPRYDESGNLFVAFDNCVPADRDARLKEMETRLKTGYSSINQERQIDNQEGVEWGDLPILPQTMVPLGSAPPAGEGATEEELHVFSLKVAEMVEEKLSGQ